MEKINRDYNQKELLDNYYYACQNPKFEKLIRRLKIDQNIAMKYTSKLENTLEELENCSKCKGLVFCKNKIEGHVDYPQLHNDKLTFSYAPCKYQKEAINKTKENNSITMKDILLDDKKRIPIIKWMKEFLSSIDHNKPTKGLYLHGNFGSGKTFLLSALFNELSKKRSTTLIVYFPELLSDLKSDFEDFGAKMDYLKEVDFLLIDDIGAEKVTEWSRDEILGTILQYRMNNHKTTFFTSNLSISELEIHLSNTKTEVDVIKSRRIIERIKYLTDELELIGENRRS